MAIFILHSCCRPERGKVYLSAGPRQAPEAYACTDFTLFSTGYPELGVCGRCCQARRDRKREHAHEVAETVERALGTSVEYGYVYEGTRHQFEKAEEPVADAAPETRLGMHGGFHRTCVRRYEEGRQDGDGASQEAARRIGRVTSAPAEVPAEAGRRNVQKSHFKSIARGMPGLRPWASREPD